MTKMGRIWTLLSALDAAFIIYHRLVGRGRNYLFLPRLECDKIAAGRGARASHCITRYSSA
jgi:hypothetical protein